MLYGYELSELHAGALGQQLGTLQGVLGGGGKQRVAYGFPVPDCEPDAYAGLRYAVRYGGQHGGQHIRIEAEAYRHRVFADVPREDLTVHSALIVNALVFGAHVERRGFKLGRLEARF